MHIDSLDMGSIKVMMLWFARLTSAQTYIYALDSIHVAGNGFPRPDFCLSGMDRLYCSFVVNQRMC